MKYSNYCCGLQTVYTARGTCYAVTYITKTCVIPPKPVQWRADAFECFRFSSNRTQHRILTVTHEFWFDRDFCCEVYNRDYRSYSIDQRSFLVYLYILSNEPSRDVRKEKYDSYVSYVQLMTERVHYFWSTHLPIYTR